MKQYIAKRTDHGISLYTGRAVEYTYVEVQELEPAFKDGLVASYRVMRSRPLLHRMHHSPEGFEWGYAGSGPADLARSILADCVGDKIGLDPAFYQSFKFGFIAAAPHAGFVITEFEILCWLANYLTSMAKDAGRI